MSTGSDLARLDASTELVTVTFDGTAVAMVAGDTLASGLLAAGIRSLRTTPVSGAERGPFCMMGACYDCLVVVDGVTVQACMTPARDGLVVRRSQGPIDDDR